MRIILEKSDLLEILGKHFERNFEPELVQVRADPFEVELTGIALPAGEREPRPHRLGKEDGFDGPVDVSPALPVPEDAALIERRMERNTSSAPPPVTADEASSDPRTIVEASRKLEAELAERS